MPKTRKVQVTLDQKEYQALIRVARRTGRKLAAVVRDSVQLYVLQPESERGRNEALEQLLALPSTPAPDDYSDWERRKMSTRSRTGSNAFRPLRSTPRHASSISRSRTGRRCVAFLIRYQDRVLYATDLLALPWDDPVRTTKRWAAEYDRDWRYFATNQPVEFPGRK